MSEPRYGEGERGEFLISQSSLETYLRCGLRYIYDRQEPHPWATPRMLTGTGVAAAARADNRAKIEGRQRIPLRGLIDIAVSAYEEQGRETEVPGPRREFDAGKDRTRDATRVYGVDVSPLTEDVIAAEEEMRAAFGEGIVLVGRPDVITADGIGDLKTGRPWDAIRVKRSRQLTAYGILHLAVYRQIPSRVWIDSSTDYRGNWTHARIWGTRVPKDYEAFMYLVDRARQGIEKGVFLPAPEGAWWCSESWCPYWQMCKAVAP